MRILYNNLIETAVLSKTTENINYPIENLLDSRMTRYYQSLDRDDQRITLYLAGATASYIVIRGHNFTGTATVKIQGDADNSSWDGPPTFSHTITPITDILIYKFTEVPFDYWSIYVDDPNNSNDFIQIAYIFLGTYLQLPGMDISQGLSVYTTSKSAISTGGQVFGSAGYEYRGFEVTFKNITNVQRLLINAFFEAVKNYKPFILLPWADDLVFEAPMYAVLDDNVIKWKRNDSRNYPWQCAMKFREVF